MPYLLLIYMVESEWQSLTEAQRQQIYGEYRALGEDLDRSKKRLGGSELMPTSTATTLRLRNGKRLVTDGPFAETKEQLAGFFLVEAKDLDDALEIAARIPSAKTGTIEVRPMKQN